MISLPIVDLVGFSPLYAAAAVIPLLAGGILLSGLYTQTGSLDPRPDHAADD